MSECGSYEGELVEQRPKKIFFLRRPEQNVKIIEQYFIFFFYFYIQLYHGRETVVF